MKNRDYPLAPTHFDGPPKKKKASSTPAYTKTTKFPPTKEQQAVLDRANANVSAYHQAKSQTSDPSVLGPYKRRAEMSQDSTNQIYASLKRVTKVPSKKTI